MSRPLGRAVSRPSRRLTARLAAALIVVPALAWGIGANWVLALIIAGAAAAAVAVLELPRRASEPLWPTHGESGRAGGRRDVATLSWRLTSRHGGTDSAAVARLRAIAARRLARHGASLSEPRDAERARALLGDRVHALLSAPADAQLSHRDLVTCIDALERLQWTDADADRPHPTPPPPARTGRR